MTITLAVMCVLLGLVVGAYAALALSAASQHWRVLGMRELASYRTTTGVTVGNGPHSGSPRPRTGGINGHDPDPPTPQIPPPGAPPGP